MRGAAKAMVGAATGVVLGTVLGLLLPRIFRAEPDWRETAAANTLPNRRAYTLPLNNPDMIPAARADSMRDDDVVLGVLFHGQARAYPWWLTSNYHVVNDTVNEDPLLITLCEVCGGASAFRPVLPDLPVPLSFQVCGVGQGTIQIGDQQTWSRWHPFLGTAFSGPLKGRSLERYPLLMMTWKEWKLLYPDSVVVNGSAQLRERLHGTESGHIGDTDIPSPFLRSADLTDDRLGLHELVLGIKGPDTGRSHAIPASRLVPFPNVFVAKLGDRAVLIVRQAQLAVTAFDLEHSIAGTNFAVLSTTPIRFRSPDGRIWDAFGVSRAPDGKEARLPSARGYLTEWYEWVTHSPETEIVSSISVLPGALSR